MATAAKRGKTLPTIEKLPDELLVKIFCELPAIDASSFSLVCQRFQSVFNEFVTPKFVNYARRIVPLKQIRMCLSRGIKHLNLEGSYLKKDGQSLEETTLAYLNVNGTRSDEIMIKFVSKCVALEKLSIHHKEQYTEDRAGMFINSMYLLRYSKIRVQY